MTTATAAHNAPSRRKTAPRDASSRAALGALGASNNFVAASMIVLVAWLGNSSFPAEALLPPAYVLLSLFTKQDDLRLGTAPVLVDALAATFASLLVFESALVEFFVRTLLIIDVAQHCSLKLPVGALVASGYALYAVLGNPPGGDGGGAFALCSLHAALGICVSVFLRTNRLLLGPRTHLLDLVRFGISNAQRTLKAHPSLAAGVDWLHWLAVAPIVAVASKRWFADAGLWALVMSLDWVEEISLGGFVMSAFLLVGFGASLAQDRAAGRPRYVYQLLLVIAVWASDVSVFLAAPPRLLPSIANAVVSAYFVLYCIAPAASQPKITTKPNGTLELTPVPPRATSVVLPVLAWVAMVAVDIAVQQTRGWPEPNLARVVLSVNTIGYGILMLTSTFLDSVSRDARIRARMAYLEEPAISPDAVALRQIYDDFEGTQELEATLASIGVDVRDIAESRCGGVFSSAEDAPTAPTPAESQQPLAEAGAEDPSVPLDTDSSRSGAASDASTTAHAAQVGSTKGTPAHTTPVVSNQNSFAQPHTATPTPQQPGIPDAATAASFASSNAEPLTNGSRTDAATGADGANGADAAARPKISAEEQAARERAKREADEARRKAKQQQKIEAQRLHEQRLAEAAERKERLRREQELNETVDGERRARDSIAGKERNAREKIAATSAAENRSIQLAIKSRREREERQKKAAKEAERKAAAAKEAEEQRAAKAKAEAAAKEKEAKERAAKEAKEKAKAEAKGAKADKKPQQQAPAAPVGAKSAATSPHAPQVQDAKGAKMPLPRSEAKPAAQQAQAKQQPQAPAKGQSNPASPPPQQQQPQPAKDAAKDKDRRKKDKEAKQQQQSQRQSQQSSKVNSPVATHKAGSPTVAPPLGEQALGASQERDSMIGKLLASLQSPGVAQPQHQQQHASSLLGGMSTDSSSQHSPSGFAGSGSGNQMGGFGSGSAAAATTPGAAGRPAAPAANNDDDDDGDAWTFINNQVQSVLDDHNADQPQPQPKTFGEPRRTTPQNMAPSAAAAPFSFSSPLATDTSFTVTGGGSSGHTSPGPQQASMYGIGGGQSFGAAVPGMQHANAGAAGAAMGGGAYVAQQPNYVMVGNQMYMLATPAQAQGLDGQQQMGGQQLLYYMPQ